MSAPIRLPLVDVEVLTQLHWRYHATVNAELQARYQIILLAYDGYTAPETRPDRAVQ